MDIRPPLFAGSWYPARPERLAREIDRYLVQASPDMPPGTVWGVIAPHAGLPFSGPVAAWSFACLRGLRPEIVALVGPMHRPVTNVVLTSGHDAYATPLGRTLVDCDARARLDAGLRERLGAGLMSVRNDGEHALEIELPFLQRVLGDFTLLPVMVGTRNVQAVEALGHALAAALRGHAALLVASSDLSHYETQAVARQMDEEMLRRIVAFDPRAVIEAVDEGVAYACGDAAIAAVLWAAGDLGADRVRVVHYATSGDLTGEYHRVVGYGAAVIWQEEQQHATGGSADR